MPRIDTTFPKPRNGRRRQNDKGKGSRILGKVGI
jgi:hypothetical protein